MSQTENQDLISPLATTFVVPQLPQTLISRPRLLTNLDAIKTHRLVLLSASAGSGKTTLISSWVRSEHAAGRQVAWLSLDSLDNDPTRFWTSVIASLRVCLPVLGSTALQMLQGPQSASLSTVLTSLLNDLLTRGGEMILVLDDYHVIEDQAIHDSLTFLLDHAPANLHLVLVTRGDPHVPLSRWRLRGQMVDLRDQDLAFRQEETRRFLAQISDEPFLEDEVQMLQRRTEGWIAGVQLAALAARKQANRAAFLQTLSGSHRYLMDYVQQEILARLPLSLQQFLLQIAVLTRMNAELCQAVTGETDCQERLEILERQNLFLVPLDAQRVWYRLHDLFREVLLAHLQLTQPARLFQLHERAALAYEQRGDAREALTHWLATGHFARAVALMERVAERLWLGGEVGTLSRWVMALPAHVVRQHPHLMLTTALYLLNSVGLLAEEERLPAVQKGKRLLARVEALWQGHEEGEPFSGTGVLASEAAMAVLQQRVRLLRGWIALFEMAIQRDPERQLRQLAIQMQEERPDEEILWQMVPLSVRFVLHRFLGDRAQLLPELLEAEQRARMSGNRYARIKTMQWLALCAVEAGQLHQARQVCLDALDLLSQMGGHPLLTGYFSLCLAEVSYQWNHLEEARKLTRDMLQQAESWQQVDLWISGLQTLMRIELAAGQLETMRNLLEQTEAVTRRFKSDLHRFLITEQRVQYWLAVGDLQAATNWAARRSFSPDRWQPLELENFLVLVRVLLARQRFRQAQTLMERYRQPCERLGKLEGRLPFLALSVVVFFQAGRHEQARMVLRHLLALTEAEGFLRIYLNEGEPMRRALLDLLAARSPEHEDEGYSPAYLSSLLDAFAQEAEGHPTVPALSPAFRVSAQSAASPRPQTMPLEPLSSQEQRVLRLLAAGRSNPEIARQLVVSINTVKTQVQSIYRKLGVTNRVEASAAARGMHLL